MFPHHSDQLLRIITLRRQSVNEEPYDFIVCKCFILFEYSNKDAGGIFMMFSSLGNLAGHAFPAMAFGDS